MDPQNQPVTSSTPASNPAPAPAPAPVTPAPEAKSDSIGPIIGIVIIVAVLALGGIYYYTTQIKMPEVQTETTYSTTTTTNTTEAMTASSSDSTTSLENDLRGTDVNVDSDLEGNVNSEFGN